MSNEALIDDRCSKENRASLANRRQMGAKIALVRIGLTGKLAQAKTLSREREFGANFIQRFGPPEGKE